MSEQPDLLPPGWVLTVVAEVGSAQLGLQKSASRQTGRWRTKYLRSANISSDGLDLRDVAEMDFTPAERNLYGLVEGDLVVVEASGSPTQVGRAAIWRGELPLCCYQNHLIRFRPHATIPEFALVVFRHYAASGVFARVARGIGIQHLGSQRFAQIPFPLPPLAEQRRIAAAAEKRLQELREATASLRSALVHIAEQNREILAAAVTGALVPSEASLAAAEGRSFDDARIVLHSTDEEVEQRSLLDLNAALDPLNTAVNAELLPEGWVWCQVKDMGEVRIGRQLSPKQRQGPNLRKYLRVANVYEDYIDVSDVKQMNFTPEEFEIYRLVPGDILLNEGQSLELVGRPAIFRGELEDVCFQNTLIRVRTVPGVDPEYALLVFRHYLHSGEFSRIARRSTNIAHLGLSRFAEMPFPLPPPAEQTRIAGEARERLAASKVQETSVRAALSRIQEMEREILATAVAGALVPQDKQDEPAELLLARLGPPPSPAAPSEQADYADDEQAVAMTEITVPETTRSLPDVLRRAGRPVPLPDLFAMAGYDRDSVEHVEHFYLALRAELGRTIRVVGKSGENALVEVADAP